MFRMRPKGVLRRTAFVAFACVLLFSFVHALDPHHSGSHGDMAPCVLCAALPGLLLCLVLVLGHIHAPPIEWPQASTTVFPFNREPWRLLPRRGPPCLALS